MLPAERRGLLRLELFAYYDTDPEVRATLVDLAARQPAYRYDAEYDAWDGELVAVAGRFGLDRLRGDDGVNRSGVEVLRLWAHLRLGAGDLGRAATFGLRPPEIVIESPRPRRPLESREAYGEYVREYQDRFEAAAESAGYVIPDTARKLPAHVRWLFLHIRRGMLWPAIADAEAELESSDRDRPVNEGAVRLGVTRLATLMGVDV
jgi:hypothetical protein